MSTNSSCVLEIRTAVVAGFKLHVRMIVITSAVMMVLSMTSIISMVCVILFLVCVYLFDDEYKAGMSIIRVWTENFYIYVVYDDKMLEMLEGVLAPLRSEVYAERQQQRAENVELYFETDHMNVTLTYDSDFRIVFCRLVRRRVDNDVSYANEEDDEDDIPLQQALDNLLEIQVNIFESHVPRTEQTEEDFIYAVQSEVIQLLSISKVTLSREKLEMFVSTFLEPLEYSEDAIDEYTDTIVAEVSGEK